MKKLISTFALILTLAAAALAQTAPDETKYRIYDANGKPATLDQIVTAMGGVDAVYLGEQHDDSVGHAMECELFKRAVEQYAAKRKVALSLEMFETDVQVVMDEYLRGLITESHFLLSSRPWGNYKTDYRPLVELARERKLDVIAANAPRRYVNMVSRNGRESLNALSPTAKAWLPPLPYGEPSAAYAAKFKALMGPSPEAQMGIDKILASQSLWDASMANSVANYLKANKNALTIQLNGGFHTESHLGTIDHLLKYRPKTKVLVVTMKYVDDFKNFDNKDVGIGDFVVYTEPKAKTVGVLKEILETTNKGLQLIKSVKANVQVDRYYKGLGETDSNTGTVIYLPKASREQRYVRLDWEKPEEQMVAIGDEYSLYRPSLNQAIHGRITSGQGPSIFDYFSMSEDKLESTLDISYLGQENIRGDVQTWHIVLKPKYKSIYTAIDAWIDKEGFPRQIRLVEKDGDTTTLLFSNIQRNLTIDATEFRLAMPKDVKLIKAQSIVN